jgi:thioredoxin-like negative regulator of GroEL
MKHAAWKRIAHPAILLGMILLLAFALRIVHIDRESLWWDEYATHVHLNAPTLKSFLAQSRTLDPLALPLYYSLEYGVHHYLCDHFLCLRALSISLGMIMIPLLYLLGKKLFGTRAGLIAAMLAALSPVHIYHAQGIRMYGLFALLALLTLGSFMTLLEKRKLRHWGVHLLCAAALYWTHAFAPLITVLAGIFLLIQGRKQFLLLIRWSVAHLLLLLPVAVWVSSVSFWSKETTEHWLAFPSVGGILSDIFFDDIVGFQWQFRLGSLAQALGWFRWIPDLLLAALILFLLGRWYRQWRQHFEPDSPVFLLFLWLVLPPLLLLLLSAAVRPCMFPRYTLHCSLALYLLLGGAIRLVGHKRKEWVYIFLLLLLSGCQWLWLYPGPQRTDWFSVARLLQEKSGENDLALIRDPLQGEVLLHNSRMLFQKSFAGGFASAETSWVLAAQSALALGMQRAEVKEDIKTCERESGAVRTVLSMDFFVPGPPLDYEYAINVWGINYERWFFPASCELYVYELQARNIRKLPRSLGEILQRWEREGLNYREDRPLSVQAFGSLALTLIEKDRIREGATLLQDLLNEFPLEARLFASLHRKLDNNQPPEPAIKAIRSLYKGYGYRQNGNNDFACRAFQAATAHDPENGQAFYELACEYFAAGKSTEALQALSLAAPWEEEYKAREENMFRALEKDVPPLLAWKAEEAYRAGLLAMNQGEMEKASELLAHCLSLYPGHQGAKPERAYLFMLEEELEKSAALLEAYVEECESPDARALGNLALISAVTGQFEKARDHSRRAREEDASFEEYFGRLCDLFFEEQNFEESLQELLRLKEAGQPFPDFIEDFLRRQIQ